MAVFKKLGFFGAPLLVMATGALATAACDKESLPGGEGLCGPCGDVATGDIGISGNAKLDGFFAAVATLNKSVVTINGDFELGLKNLEAAFGLEAEGSISARVDALVAAIQAEIEANVGANAALNVDIQPAQCSANVNVAVEAQAQCEVKGGCEVDPGKVDVECSGSCTGSCSGECSGEVQCKVEAPSIECEGTCEGTCEVDIEAECSGTCKGECEGECSVKNADGSCNGSCSGTCKGSCSASASGKCEGKCTGSCTADPGGASCEGEVKCEGTCEGSCEGGCTGEVVPPSAECDASADCQAQAKAQASASLECTPPQLTIGFAAKADLDASARASFEAKIGALKVNAPVMLSAFTKYSALFDGKVNGEVVFKPSPVASVTAGLEGVVEAGIEGDLFADIPLGRIDCVIPAMESSISLLGKMTSEASANISAQAKFVTAFAGGFKS